MVVKLLIIVVMLLVNKAVTVVNRLPLNLTMVASNKHRASHRERLIVNVVMTQTAIHFCLVKTMLPGQIRMAVQMHGYKVK